MKREHVTSLLEVIGLGSIVTGVALVTAPGALVVGGACLLALSWRSQR
jgi:hypothetical protein